MQRLNLHRLKVTIHTNEEKFGTDIEFGSGLNIIRAENTSGKSSCLNCILYALGFEIIIQGKKGSLNLVPALKEAIKIDDNTRRNVLESFVELEISNHQGEKITIKRFIKSENDNRLVLVDKGFRLSNNQNHLERVEFYLHDPGAATNPKGFHKFLENFFDWELPKVPRYDDRSTKLYMECLMPLHFVEQKRGWAAIQATTPTIFGIRDPKKQATEYLLGLDASKNYKLKQEITYEKNRISNKWKSTIDELKSIASYIDCMVKKIPTKPTVNIEESPILLIEQGDDWINLNQHIINTREIIEQKKEELEPKIEDADQEKEKLSKKIDELEDKLFLLEISYQKNREEYISEKKEKEKLHKRLSTIEEEIKNNQDAHKIQKYASDLNSTVAKETCPTCLQKISSSLLDPQATETRSPMSIKDNIEYLKQQRSAIKVLISQSENALQAKEVSVKNKKDKINGLRTEIRNLKSEILQDGRIPSEAELRKLIELKNDLSLYEKTRSNFLEKFKDLEKLTAQWSKILSREAELPSDLLSQTDHKKLTSLKNTTKSLLKRFGFKSTNLDEVSISLENYRPTAEGIELAFDTSASDGIRLIWSYMLAIQSISNEFAQKHLGISFFDEPRQQEVDHEDYYQFFKFCSNLEEDKNQTIITTSEDKEPVFEMTKGLDSTIINFDSQFIFQPNFEK
ncbi:AAA family ATPase [Fodinibius sp. N2]|uniref:AAA family ATPase n=1 Tax=Fodinibius alkaliphilus TaxID=3140241 RepID=UPI00315A83B0